jgi:dimethylargininase
MVATFSRIEAPGTLDGGDVCDADDRFYVGISQRTNPEGARQFGAIVGSLGYRAVTLDVRDVDGALHLKSAMSYLGDGIFVAAGDLASRLGADAGRILPVDPEEAYAANCVRVNGYALFAAGYPRLEARVAAAGLTPLRLDVSEYRKMDGGLSCLSIRL